MTRLSSTVTRRKLAASPPGPAGRNGAVGWMPRPVINLPPSSSKLSMGLSSGGGGRQGKQLLVGREALRFGGVVHLARGDVEVPLAAGERQPVAVLRMPLDQLAVREVCGMAE